MGFVFCPHGSAQPSHTNQGSYSTNMSFWQENYAFIKEVYEMRHMKMAEWMENVEKSIARIMADKVYTSSEFKRERDTFNSLCKDLERAEVRKWLQQILEILMAERAKDQRNTEMGKLDTLIKKHEELIPNVQKTAVMVDLYWKCYAYGDELKPHVEFLDGIMLSSTRDMLSKISLPRVRSFSRTLTNPSSLRLMLQDFKMVGRTPRRRQMRDFSSSMRQRKLSLDMLRTVRLLLENLILLRKRSRRSRRSSTLRLPMLTSTRDKKSLRTQMTRSMVFSITSTRTTTPWLSPSQRTRRRSSPMRLRLLRRSLRSLADSSPQSRLLLTLSTTLLPLITPSRPLTHGRMLLLLS